MTPVTHPDVIRLFWGLGWLLALHALTGINACSTPVDADGDGYAEGDDCDDTNASTYPGAPELCDGVDHNCDSRAGQVRIWYADHDADGWGLSSSSLSLCEVPPPPGYVSPAGDCDDANPSRSPFELDVCDLLDNDCDGSVDEDAPTWYSDSDQDGFGNSAEGERTCTPPPGSVLLPDDCDDADPARFPGALELCDGIDWGCDGATSDASVKRYPDKDGDGFGDSRLGVTDCAASVGYVTVAGDCRDTDRSIHPLAVELCDGIDNDCSSVVDDGIYHPDLDRDGFGIAGTSVACSVGTAVAPSVGDCNDSNAAVHPGAADASGDTLDADCGGTTNPEVHVGFGTGSSSSLRAALSSAPSGSVVWVGPGVYLEHSLSFAGRALTLKSTHGPQATRIDGAWQGRIFTFNTGEGSGARLEGFELTRGLVQGAGGAILIQGSSPAVTDCTFAENRAAGHLGQGGAIALFSSQASLSALRFTQNQAGYCYRYDDSPGSGAPGADETHWTTIESCTPGQGGALFAQTSPVQLNGITATENAAWGEGGALALYGGQITLAGATLQANQASAPCLHSESKRTVTTNSTTTTSQYALHACAESARGGALFAQGTQLELSANTVEDSSAPASCGAVGQLSATEDLTSSGVTGTLKTTCTLGLGGGVYLEGTVTSAQGETLLRTVASQGAGYAVVGGSLELVSSELLQMQAQSSVGLSRYENTYSLWDFETEQYIESGSVVTLELPLGGEGGALYLDGTTTTLRNVTLSGSSASQRGGAVRAIESTLVGSNLVLEANLSEGESVSHSDVQKSAQLLHTQVVGGEGGAISTTGGSLRLDHARLSDHRAVVGGGLALAGPAILSSVLLTDGQATGAVDVLEGTDQGEKVYQARPGVGAGVLVQDASLDLSQSVLALNQAQDVVSPDGSVLAAGLGGGLYMEVTSGFSVTLTHVILSHNQGVGLYTAAGMPTLSWSLISAPVGESAHNLGTLPSSVLTGDPGFASVNAAGEPMDFHLSATSVCVNAGMSSVVDKDGSRTDLGLYGGPQGDGFNLDRDAKPDWFWPGTYAQPPAGISSSLYDCADLDASTTACR